MNVYHIWDDKSINKFEGEYLLGKGKMRKVKGNYMVDISNLYLTFHFYVFHTYLIFILTTSTIKEYHVN
jgi:hypothetical protein